jgi:hypothetical protein
MRFPIFRLLPRNSAGAYEAVVAFREGSNSIAVQP